MKQKKTVSSWLATRFVLIVRDEETFAEKAAFRFTYSKLVLIAGVLFCTLTVLSFILATTLLARWFDPQVAYREIDQRIIELEIEVDSLSLANEMKDRYIKDLVEIMDGKVENEDSVISKSAAEKVSLTGDDPSEVTAKDSLFRKEFEREGEANQLTNLRSSEKSAIEDVFFFPPVKGVVSRRFDLRGNHLGVDVLAKVNEPIKAASDGTVIISSWTQDSGYVVGVQHKNQLISFYKHNSVLLKKVGDNVRAGDIVSIIGNSGEYTDGQHLHFELWYNGNPVDPENFILFE